MKNLNLTILGILTLFASIVISGCSYTADCINATGNQITQTRQMDAFSTIKTSGSIKIFLKQGNEQSVKLTASDNVMPLIKTSISGKTLTIKSDRNVCRQGEVTVYITSKTFDGIHSSGSAVINSEGKLHVEDFSIDVSGSGILNLDLSARNITTGSSGSTDITLKGIAKSNRLNMSGSGSLNAPDLVTGIYNLDISGSCNLILNVQEELNINSSGSSQVIYHGNPKRVNNSSSGSSSLKKVE